MQTGLQVGLSFVQAHSAQLFGKQECTVKDVELNPEACDLFTRCSMYFIDSMFFQCAGGVLHREGLTCDEAE